MGKILRSPVLLFVLFALGILVGILQPPFIGVLEVFGDIFLTMLELCMLPIIATMLTISIHNVLKAKVGGKFLGRAAVSSVVIVAAVFGITAGVSWLLRGSIFQQKDFQLAASKLLIEGEAGINSMIREISSYIRPEHPETITIGEMILNIFPDNIIRALSQSNVLQVVFFSIVLGIATVTLPPKNEELVMDLCEAVNHIFMEIFDFIMIFLAPAIFCIISVQISALGMDVLLSLVRLLLMTIGICLIICGVSMAVMCAVTGTGVRAHLKAMGKPLYMAFATGDAIPTIPYLIDNLHNHHKINRDVTNTILPISISLFNYDGVILLALSFVGAASIYGVTLQPGTIATAFLITFLLSTSYSDIMASSYLIALLLEPFGLPAEAMIAMLIPLNPVLDAVFTATKVYPVCVTAAVMSKRHFFHPL
ncbi:dicarboxylate/amino acid:cation symporter [Enterocloster asparagiformis]|uniref:dicarboxylate/amino acid:cation symporter n=1 Tax=Enterocloster asparagiformis TaxID=333367 RepID=UPI002A824126|nr:cation:dicarboxylase symporter family transporter [Enterocloster asparagiformis]